MNKSVKSTLALVCICGIMAILMAVTNVITAPIIKENENAAANKALLQVMPDGKGFEKVDMGEYKLPETVTDVYREASGGYVFKLTTTGYSNNFVIMCGVNADGTVSGAVCLSSTETLGHEKTFGENFKDKDIVGVEAVETVSGATKTTSAYRNAVKDALNAAVILGGGSVDLRTEEEILADNLNEALPSAEGNFSKLFFAETISGIDAIYIAENGVGAVCVIGEQFIAVDENGSVISEISEELAQSVESQMEIVNSSTSTDVDLTKYSDLPTSLISAKKTATGNYVLELKAAGYGINGGSSYHPASGEYIVIRVSLTAQGRIIDCLTVSQAESKGFGDACANEKFYGQFDGKTKENYTEIDAISGATMTTNGYKKAIERAFEIVEILEGGAE